jgi:hypothetical protein
VALHEKHEIDVEQRHMATLDTKDGTGKVHVGHSTGGGEVARYIGRRADRSLRPIGPSKIVRGAKLKLRKRAPHGICTTPKNEVNEDLIAFIRN